MEPYVVVLDKAYMGESNQELGELLLKGFLKTVASFEVTPKAVLMYNEGIFVPDDLNNLALLKTLETSGTEVLTCGTCLDYFDREPKLGKRSNMKEILTLQMHYKVLRP